MNLDESPPVTRPPHPRPRSPATATPPGACDAHAHVFGAVDEFPLAEGALYAPSPTGPARYRGLLDVLGVERAVLVQPSIYGTDNACLLAALAADPVRLRGVAVLPFDVDVATIERLHGLGVRGVRCNIVDLKSGKGELPLEPLKALARRIQPFGWHLELLMHVDEFPTLDRQLADFPVPCSFGHLGYVAVDNGISTPGFQALLRLMRDGQAWVKLTGPYRLTAAGMPYEGTDDFAHALVDAAPGQLVWGSDWPHVMVKSAMPDDGELLDLLARWVPDEATRRRVLVANPGRLYFG